MEPDAPSTATKVDAPVRVMEPLVEAVSFSPPLAEPARDIDPTAPAVMR
jgi:hypothetical protein